MTRFILFLFQHHKDIYQRPGYEEPPSSETNEQKIKSESKMNDTRFIESDIDRDFATARKATSTGAPWKNVTAGELDIIYQKFRRYWSVVSVEQEAWLSNMAYPAFYFCKSLHSEFSLCFFSIISSATDRWNFPSNILSSLLPYSDKFVDWNDEELEELVVVGCFKESLNDRNFQPNTMTKYMQGAKGFIDVSSICDFNFCH